MNVLVIEPGNGSYWLQGASFVDRIGEPDPNGEYVTGTYWYHEGGPFLPDGGINIPETLTYPRKWILKITEETR